MSTFVVAYGLVWLATIVYLARLGAGQRRLARLAESLQERHDRGVRGKAG